MREIQAEKITALVERLCIEACYVLADDIDRKFHSCLQTLSLIHI